MILRVALAVLGAVAGLVAAVLLTVLWGFTTRLLSDNGTLAIVAVVWVLLTPVILFAMISNLPKPSAPRFSLWGYTAYSLLQVAAIIVVMVFGFQTQPWSWIPTTIVLVGIAGSALAVVLGRLLRSPRVPAATNGSGELVLRPWSPAPPARRRAALVLLVVVFLLAYLLVTREWAATIRSTAPLHPAAFAASGTLVGLSLAFLAAFFVCIFVSFPLALRVSNALPPGLARRRILRVVWRNSPEALDDTELEYARRYAADARTALPWLMFQCALVFFGVECEQLGEQLLPHQVFGWWLPIVFGILYLAVLVVAEVLHHRVHTFLKVNGQPAPTAIPPVESLVAAPTASTAS